MKIACISFTQSGRKIGERLQGLKENDYIITHYHNSDMEDGIKKILPQLWKEQDGLVFIGSTGMAIRLINPYIEHKTLDPAVVTVDDMGRFSISLLSGHLGGANKLAEWISDKIDALPVITTASDNRNIEAVDLFAKKNDYHIEDIKSLTKISAMMVDGKTIGFYSEDEIKIDYPNLKILSNPEDLTSDISGLIIVSSRNFHCPDAPCAVLRPKNINVGIGCRRNVDGNRIIDAVIHNLKELNLSPKGIKAIGTVEVKKDEKGILETCEYFGVSPTIFSIEEIGTVDHMFEKSQFVKDTIGVYSVAEPSAHLLGGKMILTKSKHDGITISITKE